MRSIEYPIEYMNGPRLLSIQFMNFFGSSNVVYGSCTRNVRVAFAKCYTTLYQLSGKYPLLAQWEPQKGSGLVRLKDSLTTKCFCT